METGNYDDNNFSDLSEDISKFSGHLTQFLDRLEEERECKVPVMYFVELRKAAIKVGDRNSLP